MKEGWTYKKLGEVATYINGFPFKPSDWKDKGKPIIRIQNLTNPQNVFNRCSRVDIPEKFIVRKGDVLISWSATLGVFEWDKEDAFLNQHIFKVVFNKLDVDKLFFKYVVLISIAEMSKHTNGATMKHIRKGDFDNIQIPFPPLPEQRAIVARLDSAFAHIDALKANAERQLAEARKLFQKALEEAMTPKEGWEEKTLKEVSQIAGDYGLNVSSKPFDGIRYLRITDITDWGDLNDDKVSAKVDSDKKQEELEEGDILFARTGATVGKTLVYRKEFGECLYAGYLIRYRLKKECVLPRYMHYITHSKEYYDWVSTNQEAAAQPNISARKYNLLPIHYPSLEVQHTIVAHLDALSSHVRALEAKLKKMKDECDALKQAMLREVFE